MKILENYRDIHLCENAARWRGRNNQHCYKHALCDWKYRRSVYKNYPLQTTEINESVKSISITTRMTHELFGHRSIPV